MDTYQQPHTDTAAAHPVDVAPLSCPNCQAGLVRGMRFCRNCGYRLGEGLDEYVATVRFDGLPHVAAGAVPPGQSLTPTPGRAPTSSAAAQFRAGEFGSPRRTRWSCGSGRTSWFVWPLAIVLMASAGGSVLRSKLKANLRSLGVATSVGAPRSFFGTSGFTTTDGGVLLDSVIPHGPAERAGLLGGDIITSFDGRAVNDEDQLRRLLRTTPIGKTVEVAYLRDGALRQTLLTTISSADYDNNPTLFSGGDGAQGFLGIDVGDRVPVPGTNLYGVEIDDIRRNRPADLAGLQAGDVVVEFDGTPIRTADEFNERIHRAAPGSSVNVAVMRAGQRKELVVKMGRR